METIDLYDMYRNKTEKTIGRFQKFSAGDLRVVIHICIFNSKGELLIQQRSESKRKLPNIWDVSVGGGVCENETSNQAAQRELKEELGIVYDFSKERPFFTINFETGFDDYYIINKDVELKDICFEDDEVKSVKWADKDEVLKLIQNKNFIGYYPSLINMIFETRTNRGSFKKT